MDIYYMKQALIEAQKAYSTYEIPVGAIVVYGDKIIGRGHNQKEGLKNPLAHAELIAINQASQYLGGWRLTGCTIYVTLEPCAMCAGAIINSRLDRLVIATEDPKMGCCGSVEDLTNNPRFNHRPQVEFGVLRDECKQVLKDFFRLLREK